MKKYFRINVLIIFTTIMCLIIGNGSFYAVEIDENKDNETYKYPWLNKYYDMKDYEKINLNILTDENININNSPEYRGWKGDFFSENKANECKKYTYEYLNTYPLEVLDITIDEINILKKLIINESQYGGTINERNIFIAVNLNGLEREVWFKMILAHEFFHLKYNNYDNLYKEFVEQIKLLDLKYLSDSNIDYNEWLKIQEKEFTSKHLKQGFVRRYSRFSKKEHMATIAEAVDNGAYKILAEKSLNTKKLMDAYILGNIRLFQMSGIDIKPEYYTQILPDYIKEKHSYMYNYLEEFYDIKREQNYLAVISILIAFIAYIYLLILRKHFSKEDEERIKKRLLWDDVLFKNYKKRLEENDFKNLF